MTCLDSRLTKVVEAKEMDKLQAMVSIKLTGFRIHAFLINCLVFGTQPHMPEAIILLTSKLILGLALSLVLHLQHHANLLMTSHVLPHAHLTQI